MNQHKIQMILILLCSLGFLFQATVAGLSAFLGGLISMVNSCLIARHTAKQKLKLDANAYSSFKMLLRSVAIRMALVVALLLIGFWLFNLPPLGFVAGFIVGQIGFLLDKGLSGNI